MLFGGRSVGAESRLPLLYDGRGGLREDCVMQAGTDWTPHFLSIDSSTGVEALPGYC